MIILEEYLKNNYNKLRNELVAWCSRNLNNKKLDPQDFLQKIMLKMLTSKEKGIFHSEQDLTAYIWIALRREVSQSNSQLKEKRETRQDEDSSVDDYIVDCSNNTYSPEHIFQKNQSNSKMKKEIVFDHILKEAFEVCDPIELSLFKMFYFNEKMSYSKMEKLTGLSRSNCRNKVESAKKRIKSHYSATTINQLLDFEITDEYL